MTNPSKKIKTLPEATRFSHTMRKQGKTIVLVGGVFDLLHFGHVRFLEEAKKRGDILLVALEPDERIQRVKGEGRPIHTMDKRSHVLSSLTVVDCVVLLPDFQSDEDYASLTQMLLPHVIAITTGDPHQEKKQNHAKAVNAKLIEVTPKLETPSTTQILRILELE